MGIRLDSSHQFSAHKHGLSGIVAHFFLTKFPIRFSCLLLFSIQNTTQSMFIHYSEHIYFNLPSSFIQIPRVFCVCQDAHFHFSAVHQIIGMIPHTHSSFIHTIVSHENVTAVPYPYITFTFQFTFKNSMFILHEFV